MKTEYIMTVPYAIQALKDKPILEAKIEELRAQIKKYENALYKIANICGDTNVGLHLGYCLIAEIIDSLND